MFQWLVILLIFNSADKLIRNLKPIKKQNSTLLWATQLAINLNKKPSLIRMSFTQLKMMTPTGVPNQREIHHNTRGFSSRNLPL